MECEVHAIPWQWCLSPCALPKCGASLGVRLVGSSSCCPCPLCSGSDALSLVTMGIGRINLDGRSAAVDGMPTGVCKWCSPGCRSIGFLFADKAPMRLPCRIWGWPPICLQRSGTRGKRQFCLQSCNAQAGYAGMTLASSRPLKHGGSTLATKERDLSPTLRRGIDPTCRGCLRN